MARTYSDTPEPRYVERAKFAENAGKALTLPQNAPAETEFVAIGTNNAQKFMTAAESRSVLDVKRQLKVTAAEYAAITTKDPDTMYLIVG